MTKCSFGRGLSELNRRFSHQSVNLDKDAICLTEMLLILDEKENSYQT
ncbi:hypothetical protein THOG11_70005 [Vibrio harveyi]|nr:hypothetical protein VHARVF571_600048 [Vibrio harveyi]CAH1576247.1 hypothetical protein THOD03_60005 [Vibrio harveyi]CAH1585309.1 hypothetical protein THOG11_70005 [Vibrio harveyi]